MQIGISLALGNAAADPLALAVRSAFEFGTGSAVDNRNGTAPSFTRATTASVPGFEKLDYAISGEARFGGMRRVRNRVTGDSENLNIAGWAIAAGASLAGNGTVTFGATAASAYYNATTAEGTASKTFVVSVSVSAASGTQLFRIQNTQAGVLDNYSSDLTATTTPTRFSFSVTNGASAGTGVQNCGVANKSAGGAGGTIVVHNIQIEDVTGQSNQNPSEYVSVGVESSPYHGCYVDGVKYFSTENGNTVASNVVTEATGAAIATATIKGLLIEEARTNLATYSQDMSSWGISGATHSSNSAIAPDGTTTADSYLEQVVGSANYISQAKIFADSTTYTYSHYMKRLSGRDFGSFAAQDKAGNIVRAWFDLATGVVGSTVGTGVTNKIESVGNGWYRCSMTFPSNTGGGSPTIYASAAASDGAILADGIEGYGLYFWGAQCEAGSEPSTYIPTTTVAVTRNKSDMSNATGAWFSATAGAVAIEATTPLSGGTPVLWSVDDGTANERIYIHRNASNEIHCLVVDGGVTQADLNLGAVADSTAFKLALAWSANDIAASLNGGAVVTDATATLPTVTTIHHGEDAAAANQWGGYIKRERYFATRLLNAQLVSLAA